MRNNKISIVTFLLANLAAFFGIAELPAANAQETCDPCFNHAYYECTKTCGGELHDVWCDDCCGEGCFIYQSFKCDTWQKCDPSEKSKGTCSCDGSCLEKPKDPVYYNNPEYVHEPDKGVGSSKVKLPVKMEWTDVPGWKNKGGPGAHKKDPYGPQSYVIGIEKTVSAPTERFTKVLPESEFNSVTDGAACLLPSSTEIPWHVKACCNTDGTNCGPEADFAFTTNSAPEPAKPYDPDWVGDKAAENVGLLASALKWCAIKGTNLYEIFIYVLDKYGNEICHPMLRAAVGDSCIPYTITTDRISGETSPKNELLNATAGLFTKDTTYAWEVRGCGGISGKDCTDWSQKWRLKIENSRLSGPDLYAPPDDPEGKTPVGIPVTLRWRGAPGTNSYRVVVMDLDLPDKDAYTKSQEITIDSPPLELDTVYKWKVQPCWDFESEQCEDVWSETYTFRTTGRPPVADSMKPDEETTESEDFVWEKVPGAISFVFSIKGGGIDVEKIVPATKEKTIEYDLDADLKQGKTYVWKVKTCARGGGELCGEWSEEKTITIAKIGAPTDPIPADGETVYVNRIPLELSWKAVDGAGGYRISLTYQSKSSDETNNCPTGKLKDKKLTVNSDIFSETCLGVYVWQVRACVDVDCKELGGLSDKWTFTLAQDPADKDAVSGLVVCGKNYDNPSTAWNERDNCQIAHIFILGKVIFDFLLFRLGVILLVILVLITGIIFYWPFGKLNIIGLDEKVEKAGTILRVKQLWRAAGIGYLILIFGWLIISILLIIFGYSQTTWWNIESK